jgi:hypothetical protein
MLIYYFSGAAIFSIFTWVLFMTCFDIKTKENFIEEAESPIYEVDSVSE